MGVQLRISTGLQCTEGKDDTKVCHVRGHHVGYEEKLFLCRTNCNERAQHVCCAGNMAEAQLPDRPRATFDKPDVYWFCNTRKFQNKGTTAIVKRDPSGLSFSLDDKGSSRKRKRAERGSPFRSRLEDKRTEITRERQPAGKTDPFPKRPEDDRNGCSSQDRTRTGSPSHQSVSEKSEDYRKGSSPQNRARKLSPSQQSLSERQEDCAQTDSSIKIGERESIGRPPTVTYTSAPRELTRKFTTSKIPKVKFLALHELPDFGDGGRMRKIRKTIRSAGVLSQSDRQGTVNQLSQVVSKSSNGPNSCAVSGSSSATKPLRSALEKTYSDDTAFTLSRRGVSSSLPSTSGPSAAVKVSKQDISRGNRLNSFGRDTEGRGSVAGHRSVGASAARAAPFNPAPSVVLELPWSWTGSFEVVSASAPVFYVGIRAYTSSCAAPKVQAVTKTFLPILRLEEVRRLYSDAWPKQFQQSPPTEKDIELFFFSRSLESGSEGVPSLEQRYMTLFEHMQKNDLVLIGKVEGAGRGAEILMIFTSHLLPDGIHQASKRFLWGVFRGTKFTNCSSDAEDVAMEIDMIRDTELYSPQIDHNQKQVLDQVPSLSLSSSVTVQDLEEGGIAPDSPTITTSREFGLPDLNLPPPDFGHGGEMEEMSIGKKTRQEVNIGNGGDLYGEKGLGKTFRLHSHIGVRDRKRGTFLQ